MALAGAGSLDPQVHAGRHAAGRSKRAGAIVADPDAALAIFSAGIYEVGDRHPKTPGLYVTTAQPGALGPEELLNALFDGTRDIERVHRPLSCSSRSADVRARQRARMAVFGAGKHRAERAPPGHRMGRPRARKMDVLARRVPATPLTTRPLVRYTALPKAA